MEGCKLGTMTDTCRFAKYLVVRIDLHVFAWASPRNIMITGCRLRHPGDAFISLYYTLLARLDNPFYRLPRALL